MHFLLKFDELNIYCKPVGFSIRRERWFDLIVSAGRYDCWKICAYFCLVFYVKPRSAVWVPQQRCVVFQVWAVFPGSLSGGDNFIRPFLGTVWTTHFCCCSCTRAGQWVLLWFSVVNTFTFKCLLTSANSQYCYTQCTVNLTRGLLA